MQSKTHSIIEVLTNLSIGFVISLIVQFIIFPTYGFDVQISTNLQLGLLFSIIAFIRGYIFRRIFNILTPLQKLHQSTIEVFCNVFTGWLVSFSLQLYLFPIYNINTSFFEDVQISTIFTIIAILRSLYLRRVFNTLTIKQLK